MIGEAIGAALKQALAGQQAPTIKKVRPMESTSATNTASSRITSKGYAGDISGLMDDLQQQADVNTGKWKGTM